MRGKIAAAAGFLMFAGHAIGWGQQTPAGRAFVDATIEQAGDRLRAAPEFMAFMEDSSNHGSANPLAPGGKLSFLPLDDSATVRLLRLVNTSLKQLPEGPCAEIMSGGTSFNGEGFLDWLAANDSSTVQGWVTLFTDLALTVARHIPPNPKPPREEGQRVLMATLSALSEAEQQRLVLATEGGTPGEQCWAARQVFGGLAAQPVPDQIIALRTFFP